MIYPIAVPDTCHIVDGLRIVDWECGEEVVLTWENRNRFLSKVESLVEERLPFSVVVAAHVLGPPLGLRLDDDLCGLLFFLLGYVAYVRGVCGNKNTQYYSEWSDGIEVLRLNKYHVEAVANNAGRGRVEGGGEYYEGDTATLTALPWTLWGFLQWDDGSTENPRRVVVTQDTAFRAIFVSREAIEAVPKRDAVFSLMTNPAWGSVSCALHDAGLAGGGAS